MNRIKAKLEFLVQKLKSEGLNSYETNVSKVTRETPIDKPIVGLNTSGCSYRKQGVGCFHCGHLKGYEKPEEVFQQFVSDVNRFDRRDEIYVYSNGSFFDSNEIPSSIQKRILDYLIRSGFRMVIVESRPDFIDEKGIDGLLDIIPAEQLYVGLGFDTFNEDIRNLCLNKGFSTNDYDNATEILYRNSVSFETRVVVKPPFLTEQEAIEEAIKTTLYAFEKGSPSISLEPLALQKYTLQDYLFNKGMYRVPWLWSLISIVKATHNLGCILISGENFLPLPYETAHNCTECYSEIKEAIYQFNATQQFRLLDKLDCSCKKQWRDDLTKKEAGLYERILNQIN